MGDDEVVLAELARAWATQSCTWNWIQAAARMLSVRAGMKCLRSISSRQTEHRVGLVAGGIGTRAACSARRRRRPRPSPGSLRSLPRPS